MYQSSKGVMTAADQFNKQVDMEVLYKVNKIRISGGSSGYGIEGRAEGKGDG